MRMRQDATQAQAAAPQNTTTVPQTQSAAPEDQADTQPPQPTIDDLIAQLVVAKNNVERINILENDSDFVFDFGNPSDNVKVVQGKGGSLVTASRSTFPAAVGNGISMTVGFIGPCGLNSPHIHPRASEMTFSVNGTFVTGFIAENGARTVVNNIEPGQMAIFPKGSIHWQANLGCKSVMFVAGLNDEDPGTTQVAQSFFNLPEEVLQATMGNADLSKIQAISSGIPENVAQGLMSCMKRCGLIKTQPTRPSYPGGGYYNYPYQNSYPTKSAPQYSNTYH